MGEVTIKDYEKINNGVGWLNMPKAIVMALFAIIDTLGEIRDELRKMNHEQEG